MTPELFVIVAYVAGGIVLPVGIWSALIVSIVRERRRKSPAVTIHVERVADPAATAYRVASILATDQPAHRLPAPRREVRISTPATIEPVDSLARRIRAQIAAEWRKQ